MDAERCQRIMNCTRETCNSSNGSGFAGAFYTERVTRTWNYVCFNLERRIFIGARHVVIHKGPSQDLARFIHDDPFAENLSYTLHDTAMQLPLKQKRVHDSSDIVHREASTADSSIAPAPGSTTMQRTGA